MAGISDEDYQQQFEPLIGTGFTIDPPDYDHLRRWSSILMNLVSARSSFEIVRDEPVILYDVESVLRQQAFFVAGIMAYGRCYASTGPRFPKLDAKAVFKGTQDGLDVHLRLTQLRNKFAAHTEVSDLVRLTIAVKEEDERILVRHFSTSGIPIKEIPDFLEAVEHSSHFATVSLNKHLDKLQAIIGKQIVLD